MKKHKVPHVGCPRGKRVRLILKDGTRVDDRFVDCCDRWVLLRVAGRVPKGSVRAFIVLKGEG